jgi:hypothetical protein
VVNAPDTHDTYATVDRRVLPIDRCIKISQRSPGRRALMRDGAAVLRQRGRSNDT